MSVENTIAFLKQHERFSSEPTFTDVQVNDWEKQLRFQFPASYRSIVLQGNYDIANFYFEPPEILATFPGFLTFARWNDDRFAFNMGDSGAEGPIYVLLEGTQPLKRYDSLDVWFADVAALADRPVNPE